MISSLKTSLLFMFLKPHLPNLYYAYSSDILQRSTFWFWIWKHWEIPILFFSLGLKSHIFGSRYGTDSVPCQTEFTVLLLKELLLRTWYGLILEAKKYFSMNWMHYLVNLKIALELLTAPVLPLKMTVFHKYFLNSSSYQVFRCITFKAIFAFTQISLTFDLV